MSAETCAECHEAIDPEFDDSQWSNVQDKYICFSCYESDVHHASTAYVIEGGKVEKYTVGDYAVFDEYGDDPNPRWVDLKRQWVSSDAWRGHYETTLGGFVPVVDGWTTGGWDDAIAQRKQTFNQWAEGLLKSEVIPPCRVALIFDPTSNVFSMAVTLLVEAEHEAKFKEWLSDDLDDLYNALS